MKLKRPRLLVIKVESRKDVDCQRLDLVSGLHFILSAQTSYEPIFIGWAISFRLVILLSLSISPVTASGEMQHNQIRKWRRATLNPASSTLNIINRLPKLHRENARVNFNNIF